MIHAGALHRVSQQCGSASRPDREVFAYPVPDAIWNDVPYEQFVALLVSARAENDNRLIALRSSPRSNNPVDDAGQRVPPIAGRTG